MLLSLWFPRFITLLMLRILDLLHAALYKLISKILTARLQSVIADIVDIGLFDINLNHTSRRKKLPGIAAQLPR